MEVGRDGVHIHYDVSGAGPAVLLSHGFGASSHMFAGNVGPLAVDHTVITWDLRGHGATDSPTDPAAYSVATAVDDMAAILDAVGVERATVGGHSLGGYLSLAFHLAHRDRVEALVLIDTGPGYRSEEAREKWNRMAQRYADDLEQRGLAALGAGGGELSPAVHRDAAGLVLAGRRILTQQDGRVIESLPAIDVPTLVIVGEKDKPFLNGSSYMAEKIPDATLVVVAGAGHSPNVTRPDVFDAELRTFLERVRTAS